MPFFAPAQISAFIWVYLCASSAIKWNSISEIVPSASAFETWSAIVFSLLSARTLTSSCFLALTKRRQLWIYQRHRESSSPMLQPRARGQLVLRLWWITDRRRQCPSPYWLRFASCQQHLQHWPHASTFYTAGSVYLSHLWDVLSFVRSPGAESTDPVGYCHCQPGRQRGDLHRGFLPFLVQLTASWCMFHHMFSSIRVLTIAPLALSSSSV